MPDFGCWICGAIVPNEGTNGSARPRKLRFCDPHLKGWKSSYEIVREKQTGLFDFVIRMRLEASNTSPAP
jgi:hypothetical protein